MSSHRQIYYQIVFGTKNREPTISETHCEELYKYIWGIIKNKKCHLYRINGIEDHIHIFSDLHPSVGLAEFRFNFFQSQIFDLYLHGCFNNAVFLSLLI